jgi:hypothetical protein
MMLKEKLEQISKVEGAIRAELLINYVVSLTGALLKSNVKKYKDGSSEVFSTVVGNVLFAFKGSEVYQLSPVKTYINTETAVKGDVCTNVHNGIPCHKKVVVPSVIKGGKKHPMGCYCITHFKEFLIAKKRGITKPYGVMKDMLKCLPNPVSSKKDVAVIYPVTMRAFPESAEDKSSYYFVLFAKSSQWVDINGVIAKMCIDDNKVKVDIIGHTEYTKLQQEGDELVVNTIKGFEHGTNSNTYKKVREFEPPVRILTMKDRDFRILINGEDEPIKPRRNDPRKKRYDSNRGGSGSSAYESDRGRKESSRRREPHDDSPERSGSRAESSRHGTGRNSSRMSTRSRQERESTRAPSSDRSISKDRMSNRNESLAMSQREDYPPPPRRPYPKELTSDGEYDDSNNQDISDAEKYTSDDDDMGE